MELEKLLSLYTHACLDKRDDLHAMQEEKNTCTRLWCDYDTDCLHRSIIKLFVHALGNYM